MWTWIRAKLRTLAQWRQTARDLHPDTFRAMAGELAELAEAASKIRPEEQAFLLKIRRIRQEMLDLQTMTSRPEFRLLTPKKRQELRENLLSSRKQLLKTLSDAPVLTTTRQ